MLSRLRTLLYFRMPDVAGALLFGASLIVLPGTLPWATRLLIAFDTGAVVVLAWSSLILMRTAPKKLPETVRNRDEGRITSLLLSIILVSVVIAALAVEIGGNRAQQPFGLVLAIGSLILLWVFFNFSFAIHYAHHFFDKDYGNGIAFPGEGDRTFWDFLYFGFTIGMTFQVSDAAVQTSRLRRLVLVHAVLSFGFNVLVLAVAINLAATLIN